MFAQPRTAAHSLENFACGKVFDALMQVPLDRIAFPSRAAAPSASATALTSPCVSRNMMDMRNNRPEPDYLDPAHGVIRKFVGPQGRLADGINAVCKITGRSYTQVYRWMRSKEKGGTGGMIPIDQAQQLIDWARKGKRRVDLDPRDFFGSKAA